MKVLTWKLVLPLTIISFVIFTKWWHVQLDGFEEILTGFPLPYVCSGWHTSMSLQIFVSELFVDLIFYFTFWLIIVFGINRFVIKIKIPKVLSIILFSVSGYVLIGLTLLAINPDNIYTLKRDFEIEVKETGFHFIWDEPDPGIKPHGKIRF